LARQPGPLPLLYLSPEAHALDGHLPAGRVPVLFFAIDEAHCISDMGHDFRPNMPAQPWRELFPTAPSRLSGQRTSASA